MLYRIKQDSTVSYSDREPCIVMSKKVTLKHSHCHSKTHKTEPFLIPTANPVLLNKNKQRILHCWTKKNDWTVLHANTKHIIHFESITKVRRPNRELWLITSKKERLNRFQRPKLRFVSLQQRTGTNYIEKEKSEPFQDSFRFIPTENCD